MMLTWIVRYLATKSEANTDNVGESNIEPPSFHVIIVFEFSVPLKVIKGLSLGTTIFSLNKPKFSSKKIKSNKIKTIFDTRDKNKPVCSWFNPNVNKLRIIRSNRVNSLLYRSIITSSWLINIYQNRIRIRWRRNRHWWTNITFIK